MHGYAQLQTNELGIEDQSQVYISHMHYGLNCTCVLVKDVLPSVTTSNSFISRSKTSNLNYMFHVESIIGSKEFTLGHESKIQENDALLMYAFLPRHLLLVLTQENTPPMFYNTKLTLSLNFAFKCKIATSGYFKLQFSYTWSKCKSTLNWCAKLIHDYLHNHFKCLIKDC